jgi:ABC-2 type transport system ATP-binding protein
MTAVIRTEELTKRYRRLRALDRVNLEVQEGAIYALVGPNGAGKTTSIKILMNLISATSGHAAVLGVDSKADPRQILQRHWLRLRKPGDSRMDESQCAAGIFA